jgi:hypothetical protein
MPAYAGRTVTKKYRSERKGRPNFGTALHYNPVGMMATHQTRAAKSAVATRSRAYGTAPMLTPSTGTTLRAKIATSRRVAVP